MSTTTAAVHSPTAADPRRWIGLAVLVLAVSLVAIDATVLSLAIPSISETLHPSGTQLLWIGDSYSFVLAGLLVSMGALSDRIGRKKLLLIGSSAFGAASLLAAYAPGPGWLIMARALLGVAGATIMPSTLSLIRSLFPDDRERATAIGIWGAGATAGAALGPLVGGLLLEHFWWGSVFLLNLPVLALLLVLGAWLLPESRDPKPGSWDVRSVVLSLAGVIGVVYAIKEAAANGLGHWYVPAAFLLGAAALTAFVRRQLRLPTPLLDVRLFRNPRFTAAALGSLTALIGLSGVVFFMSQYLQLVRGYSPLAAGIAELPAFVGAVVGGLLTAQLARRTGARVTLTGGLLAMGLGIALLGWVHPLRRPGPHRRPRRQVRRRVRRLGDGVRTRHGPRHRPGRLGGHRDLRRFARRPRRNGPRHGGPRPGVHRRRRRGRGIPPRPPRRPPAGGREARVRPRHERRRVPRSGPAARLGGDGLVPAATPPLGNRSAIDLSVTARVGVPVPPRPPCRPWSVWRPNGGPVR